MEDRWLSLEEISDYLGMSRETIYLWINNKDMPAHRVGRFWKFKTNEIDEWVKSGGTTRQTKSASKKRKNGAAK